MNFLFQSILRKVSPWRLWGIFLCPVSLGGSIRGFFENHYCSSVSLAHVGWSFYVAWFESSSIMTVKSKEFLKSVKINDIFFARLIIFLRIWIWSVVLKPLLKSVCSLGCEESSVFCIRLLMILVNTLNNTDWSLHLSYCFFYEFSLYIIPIQPFFSCL